MAVKRKREHLINCCAILKSEHFNFFRVSPKSVDCRLIFFADVTSRTFKCYKATTTMVCGGEKCTRKYFSLTCATSVQERTCGMCRIGNASMNVKYSINAVFQHHFAHKHIQIV